MQDVTIMSFCPSDAPEDDLSDFHQVLIATYAADLPRLPRPSYASFAEQLRMPTSLGGPRRFWVARVQGRIIGTARAFFPEWENRNLTIATVRVPPELRRQGIGTALLRAALPEVRAQGRDTMTGQMRADGAGEQWALSLGFRRVQQFTLQSLIVADVDPGLWETPAPPGFRAEGWIGAAPLSLVDGFARARTAIADAPTGESSRKFPDWTVQRVRDREAEIRGRGCELRTVVAVHEASGAVAGLTEMEVQPSRPDHAFQLDTAVLAQFRGHGLGRFVKGTMMRGLLTDRPHIERVSTQTDASNTYMIRVNHQLGYVTDHLMTIAEGSTEKLAV
jgi:mycothiol synthase